MRSGPVLHQHKFDSRRGFICHGCSIAIYEDCSLEPAIPDYQLLAQTVVMDEVGGVSKPLAFHPTLGILAAVLDESTYIWRFAEDLDPSLSMESMSTCTDDHLIEVYDQPLNDMTFSSCGQYLYGDPVVEGLYCVVKDFDPITISLQSVLSTSLSDEADFEPEFYQISRASLLEVSHPALSSQVPSAQSSNTIAVASTSGQLQQTVVSYFGANNAVVLQAIDRQGTLHIADLLRLPKSGHIGSSYPTVLSPIGKSEIIQMILNKALQETYSFLDSPGLVLPLVLEWRRDTISTFTHKRFICSVDEKEDSGRKRRRCEVYNKRLHS